MYNIIARYIGKMTKDDVRDFAHSKNIDLSEHELDFTYDFLKRNYQNILSNPKLFNLERYKSNYSEENYEKINKVWQEYFQRFSSFL